MTVAFWCVLIAIFLPYLCTGVAKFSGGCASGTLFTVGGGNARMLVTLFFFICGSVIATHHVDWWFALRAWMCFSSSAAW